MPTVSITAPPDAADELVTKIVENRLAACVNRIPCRSTYWWDEEIQREDEELLLAKTTDARYEDLVAFVEREHPYEVPGIERFDERDVLASFGAWIETETDS